MSETRIFKAKDPARGMTVAEIRHAIAHAHEDSIVRADVQVWHRKIKLIEIETIGGDE